MTQSPLELRCASIVGCSSYSQLIQPHDAKITRKGPASGLPSNASVIESLHSWTLHVMVRAPLPLPLA